MNVFLCILAVVFALPLLRYLGFYLVNQRTGELGEIRERLGADFWPSLVWAYCTGVFSDVLVLLTAPFAPLFKNNAPGEGVPVVFVHGLYHNTAAWIFFRIFLARAGHKNVYFYGYNSFTKPFAPAVDGLVEFLDRVLAENPGQRAVLIGHSLGGLVSRRAAADPRFQGQIAALVTLGSPHHGSELAALGVGPMARSLFPGREIEQTLEQTPDITVPRLAVYTLLDDYVFPFKGLRIGREGWQEQVCAPMSHVHMLYSQDVSWRVASFLEDALRE